MRLLSAGHAPIAAAALACAGCVMTHPCVVPDPALAGPVGEARLPVAVAVRHLPPIVPTPVTLQRDPYHRWSVDPEPPTRVLFDRLAGAAFAPVAVAPEGTGPDPAPEAVLEVRLDRLDFGWKPVGFGTYTASVRYHAVLRAGDGRPVTELEVDGDAVRNPVYSLSTHCRGIADAVSFAMTSAGSRFVAALREDEALAAWLASRREAGAPPIAAPAPPVGAAPEAR